MFTIKHKRKQDRFTTCFKTCGTNFWAFYQKVQNDQKGVSGENAIFWREKVAHFDANVQNERS